jgi:hypothetical protein
MPLIKVTHLTGESNILHSYSPTTQEVGNQGYSRLTEASIPQQMH